MSFIRFLVYFFVWIHKKFLVWIGYEFSWIHTEFIVNSVWILEFSLNSWIQLIHTEFRRNSYWIQWIFKIMNSVLNSVWIQYEFSMNSWIHAPMSHSCPRFALQPYFFLNFLKDRSFYVFNCLFYWKFLKKDEMMIFNGKKDASFNCPSVFLIKDCLFKK